MKSQRFGGWIKGHAFLLQLLLTTLLVCYTPLIFVEMHAMRVGRAQLEQAACEQLETTARSAGAQLDSLVRAFISVQQKIYQHTQLTFQPIDLSVASELETIRTMNQLSLALPDGTDCALVAAGERGRVYTTKYKYTLCEFAAHELGVSEEALAKDILGREKKGFVPWSAENDRLVYVCPIRIASANQVSRFCVFWMPASSVRQTLFGMIPNHMCLERITDEKGAVIFENGAQRHSEAWEKYAGGETLLSGGDGKTCQRRIQVKSAAGYTLWVSAEETEKLAVRSGAGLSATASLLLSALALMIILLSVAVNYRPIRELQRKVSIRSATSKTEIGSIAEAIEQKAKQTNVIKQAFETQRAMMIDRIYECLLNGRLLTNEEYELLHWEDTPFFLIALDLKRFEAIQQIRARVSGESCVRVVALPTDGYCVFICYCPSRSREAQAQMLSHVQTILGEKGIQLGVSAGHNRLEDFRTAYVEATLAHSRTVGCQAPEVVFAQDMEQEGDRKPFADTQTLAMRLIRGIRGGSESVLEEINQLFDAVERQESAPEQQQYAFFQLKELLLLVLKRTDTGIDKEAFEDAMRPDNLFFARKYFLDAIGEACRRQALQENAKNEAFAKEVAMFIEVNYTNPFFGLDQVAQRFGMNISNASRMMKEILGVNFKKYLAERRLEQAKQLLDTSDFSVGTIATKVGFTTASYFVRVFKEKENRTPVEYRKRTE